LTLKQCGYLIKMVFCSLEIWPRTDLNWQPRFQIFFIQFF